MVQIPRTIFYKLKQEVQFFNNFLDDELLIFLKLMTTESYRSGDVIFKEFDPGDCMYILVKGEVQIKKRVTRKDNQVQETTMANLRSGECFGEMGLIDNRPRSATAMCTNDSVVFIIKLDKLLKIARNPRLAFLSFKLFRNFSIMLAGRLRDTNQRVVELTLETGNYSMGTSDRAAPPDDQHDEDNQDGAEDAAEDAAPDIEQAPEPSTQKEGLEWADPKGEDSLKKGEENAP